MAKKFKIQLLLGGLPALPAAEGRSLAEARGWVEAAGAKADTCEVYRGDRLVITYTKLTDGRWVLVKKENGND